MRSRPGAARTILLFHTISVRPSKQPQIMEYVPSRRCPWPPSYLPSLAAILRGVSFSAATYHALVQSAERGILVVLCGRAVSARTLNLHLVIKAKP